METIAGTQVLTGMPYNIVSMMGAGVSKSDILLHDVLDKKRATNYHIYNNYIFLIF